MILNGLAKTWVGGWEAGTALLTVEVRTAIYGLQKFGIPLLASNMCCVLDFDSPNPVAPIKVDFNLWRLFDGIIFRKLPVVYLVY